VLVKNIWGEKEPDTLEKVLAIEFVKGLENENVQ